MRFTNATLPGGSTHDIEVAGGRIAALLPASTGAAGSTDVDLGGALVLPPLVDGHIHLDKTLLGLPWLPNQAAGNRVADRIEAERKVRAARTVPESVTGANLVRQVVASGTLHMRCHVDIDNQLGLRNLHEILKVREQFRDLVTIEIVAFPQSGILRSPGTAELLDAAIAAGADLLGGLDPVGIDGDLDGHLDPIFAIAQRRGVGIDQPGHDAGLIGSQAGGDRLLDALRRRRSGGRRRSRCGHRGRCPFRCEPRRSKQRQCHGQQKHRHRQHGQDRADATERDDRTGQRVASLHPRMGLATARATRKGGLRWHAQARVSAEA